MATEDLGYDPATHYSAQCFLIISARGIERMNKTHPSINSGEKIVVVELIYPKSMFRPVPYPKLSLMVPDSRVIEDPLTIDAKTPEEQTYANVRTEQEATLVRGFIDMVRAGLDSKDKSVRAKAQETISQLIASGAIVNLDTEKGDAGPE